MPRERTTDEPLLVCGPNAVLGLLRSGVAVDRVYALAGQRMPAIVAAAQACGAAIQTVDRASLDRTARGTGHQGVVALAAPFRYAALEDLADAPNVLVLDGVQDPRNLGALLRSSRAAGVCGVVLPQDRSAAVTPVVATASAGTLFDLTIARVPNLVRAMESLKGWGFWTIGLVPGASRTLWELDPPPRPALVVGGEGAGLRQLVRRACDFEVTIPMAAGVESLNVSVAAAVALFELRRRGALGP
ncbi:MAG: 23S rRNA (guanosine(2251)-2'-O)-methyltransferase RlmB [bacterium]|nr:23S rRNA (guanosine(2251)-2'-O)-methyltransferase RlmB [bacterium]